MTQLDFADIQARVDRLELPFGPLGVDPYGISKRHLARGFRVLGAFYKHYFRTRVRGIERIPQRGRAMLVGNHSGGFAVDAGMALAAAFFEMDPPRLAQGMAEKFIHRTPIFGSWACRTGQFTGLPEHAERLLEDERLLLVFPEGSRGTAKLYRERHSLVDFGTGFVRLALKTKAPIVPFAFVGGGEAVPTIANLYALGKLLGVPYIPVTPYLLPIPLPVQVGLYFGAPLRFLGTGNEDDAHIAMMVDEVKQAIGHLLEQGRTDLA